MAEIKPPATARDNGPATPAVLLRDEVLVYIARTLALDEQDLGAEPQFGLTPGWDSLGHMNLIVAIESAVGSEIDLEQVPLLTSATAIVEYLVQHNYQLPMLGSDPMSR